MPDGFADRLLWDDARSCLVIHYVGQDGLDRDDRSDQVVHIEVIEGGQRYGRSAVGSSGLGVRTVNWTHLIESYQLKLLEDMPELDATLKPNLDMWTIPLRVLEAGTEGGGLKASAILDGRAGAWSYYPVDHPWENPLLSEEMLPISLEDNDLQIIYGGTGYLLSPALLESGRARLSIRLTGDGIGTLGFVPGGDLTQTRFLPGDNTPVTETIDTIEVTGDVLNPLFPRPGNWRNFLAHTPANGHPLTGWSLPWAASEPGQIANLLIVADAVGKELVAEEMDSQAADGVAAERVDQEPDVDDDDSLEGNTNVNSLLDESPSATPDDIGGEIESLAGLGQGITNDDQLPMSEQEDEQEDEGQSTDQDRSADEQQGEAIEGELEPQESEYQESEPTSGIGYQSGVFDIQDSNGTPVRGWVIRYETDVDGRVYVNAKGSAKSVRNNMTRERVGVPDAVVYRHGWTIERNPAAILDARGWTLKPQGSGTGFQCEGIQLFGQLIALPPMSNQTESPDGYDVESAPQILIDRLSDAGSVLLAKASPEFDMRAPAQGRIVGVTIDANGSGYYRTPEVMTLEESSGEAAQLAASLGDDGRCFVTTGDEVAVVNLAGWEAHADGDFNNDGISDLLLHNPGTGESAIWNLSNGASVPVYNGQPQAHALPSLLPAWKIGGIGRFGMKQPGCCVLWRNEVTGQNAIWIIDSSHPDPSNWIQPESRFLPGVVDLGWSMACTNNAACNVGDRLYWIDPTEGSIAQWKIAVDPSRPTEEWLEQHEYLCDADGEQITGMDSTWELIAAGSLAGRPRSDGANAFRDLLFFDRDSGRSAIWLLDGSGTQIDGAAPNGGAGFVTRSGAVIGGDIRHYRPVGIGQYALEDVQWSHSRQDSGRTQWFPTIGWTLPGTGPWFTWRFDRSVDAVRTNKAGIEGTGRSAKPFQVDRLR